MEIDFVVTWVDMNDPRWQADFEKYSGRGADKDIDENSVSEARFRDYGFLKYWFRGVEKFAPWVRRIHFVTCGQAPDWLDTTNPKLHLVDHKDYIPGEFLPCFNSNVLEYYMHRIPGLAERFVYFNDDFFITNHVDESRFFQGGLPCDIAAFRFNSGGSQWAKMLKNNIRIINAHFDKREVMARDRAKWFDPSYGGKALWNHLLRWYPRFVTLRTPHNAQPYLKSTFDEVWAAVGDELTAASAHRFRTSDDLTPELFRTWQICRSNFAPYNTYRDTHMYALIIHPWRAIHGLRAQVWKLICLNDSVHIRNYQQVMSDLNESFEAILPEISGFEK